MTKQTKKRLHYLAVVIVFLTFLIREVLHEKWHELADSIERAEQEIDIRSDILGNYAELRRIENTTDLTYRDVAAARQEQIEASAQHPPNNHGTATLEKVIDGSLHDMEFADDALQELATKIVLARTKLETVGPLAREVSRKRENERLKIRKARDSIRDECLASYDDSCRDGLERITSTTDKFVDAVLEDAEGKRNSYGLLASISGWVGVVLFTSGSVVAMFSDEKPE